MTERKKFMEPELVKYEESLDEVTLQYNAYDREGWHQIRPHG